MPETLRPMLGPPEHCCCRDGDQPCGLWLDGGADLYPWYPRDICPGCVLHNGRSESHAKRLTDAECAAEFWRAATVSERALAAQAITREPGDYLPVAKGSLAAVREQLTWHRFAIYPNAREES